LDNSDPENAYGKDSNAAQASLKHYDLKFNKLPKSLEKL